MINTNCSNCRYAKIAVNATAKPYKCSYHEILVDFGNRCADFQPRKGEIRVPASYHDHTTPPVYPSTRPAGERRQHRGGYNRAGKRDTRR